MESIFKRKMSYLKTFVIAAAILLSGNLKAQYNDIEVTSLSRDMVPKDILTNHAQRFADVLEVEWTYQSARFIAQQNGAFYVVRFKKDGHSGHKAFYDAENNFVAYVGFVTNFSLPDIVKDTAAGSLAGSYIKSGEIIELGNPSFFVYRVRVHSDGYLRYLYFDKYGNRIDKRNLAPTVFSFI